MYYGTALYQLKDLPVEQHYAVLYEDRIATWDGYDERGSSETIIRYKFFKSEDELQKWIIEEANTKHSTTKYKVVHVTPCNVDISVSVKVGIT